MIDEYATPHLLRDAGLTFPTSSQAPKGCNVKCLSSWSAGAAWSNMRSADLLNLGCFWALFLGKPAGVGGGGPKSAVIFNAKAKGCVLARPTF